MSKRITFISLLGLLLIAALSLSGCSGQKASGGVATGGSVSALRAAENGSEPPRRTISVNGIGTASAAPDIAYVNLGVDLKSASPAEAAAENTQRMNGVMAAIKELGVADKDVLTVSYGIFVEQRYDKQGQPTGEIQYRVVNQVRVTVRDLTKVGALLEKAVAAGANNVGGVTFSLADPEALQKGARDKAIANARARAQQLAAGLGVKLGAPQQVSEYGGEMPRPLAYGMGDAAVEKAAAVPPISTGELTVSIQVSVSFAIE